MRNEFAAAGHDIHVVAVNGADAVSSADELTAKCRFPVLQDTDALGVWDLMQGIKDDLYIYDKDGGLALHLRYNGGVPTDLSAPADYANFKQMVLDVDAGLLP